MKVYVVSYFIPMMGNLENEKVFASEKKMLAYVKERIEEIIGDGLYDEYDSIDEYLKANPDILEERHFVGDRMGEHLKWDEMEVEE